MTRGQKSEQGDTRVAPNGYHYIRTSTGWELVHRHKCEGKLGRPLTANERVRFRDGDRNNLSIANLEVYIVKEKSDAARRAYLEAKIEELQAELESLDEVDEQDDMQHALQFARRKDSQR